MRIVSRTIGGERELEKDRQIDFLSMLRNIR